MQLCSNFFLLPGTNEAIHYLYNHMCYLEEGLGDRIKVSTSIEEPSARIRENGTIR